MPKQRTVFLFNGTPPGEKIFQSAANKVYHLHGLCSILYAAHHSWAIFNIYVSLTKALGTYIFIEGE